MCKRMLSSRDAPIPEYQGISKLMTLECKKSMEYLKGHNKNKWSGKAEIKKLVGWVIIVVHRICCWGRGSGGCGWKVHALIWWALVRWCIRDICVRVHKRWKVGRGPNVLKHLEHQLPVLVCSSILDFHPLQLKIYALAIVWSCEHFHLYIYSKDFTMVTDHKPLKLTWNNPRSKPPARIERWGLQLQPYNLKVYRKGSDNPAGYMSRHPIQTQAHTKNTRATR